LQTTNFLHSPLLNNHRNNLMKINIRSLWLPLLFACAISVGGCGGKGGSGTSAAAVNPNSTAPKGSADITSSILANANVTLNGDAVINLPAGTTTYTGIISGKGTLTLSAVGGTTNPGTLIITQASTFTLPDAQQVELITKTNYPGAGYALTITGSNPPVLTIDPGATLQLGTNATTDISPNIIATSDSRNAAALVNGEVNLDNIRNNGQIVLNNLQFVLLGEISGSGSIVQAVGAWGGHSMRGVNSMTGAVSLSAGHDFGSNHVAASMPNAKAVLNEGSWLVWSPPGSTVTVPHNIYEAAFGNDINFHAIGNSTIVMTGVYSHTDNSPHNSPNLVNPGLSDPNLNFAKAIYRNGVGNSNGNDGSYRGVNIEAGAGTVQWGDGTHANFFLPSGPSPAAPYPTLGTSTAVGNKNAYINLRGSTLTFNYNAPVTLNIGITGGGGGPYRGGEAGWGNVTIMPTAGNDVTFAQPQNYNGITTIGANAKLRLGAGAPVPYNAITVRTTGNTTALLGSYNGDSSLLTAESVGGALTDAIVNNGTLIVQNTVTPITLSHISGTGSLVQAGAATTTLLTNSYTGSTTINAGAVTAGNASAFGNGSVTNNAGLGLAAGQYEITLGGNFLQSATGTLTLPVAGIVKSVSHGHITTTGSATLGGTLTLNFTGGPYTAGQQLVLIDATGGISGAFSSIVTTGWATGASGAIVGTTFVVTLL
jgi:autotransporter-associated beta strand protein